MWPQLESFEYPGRFLIIGKGEQHYFTVYGVTARSDSSRAKKYVFNQNTNTITVEPTDIGIMSQGNLDLLDYTAVKMYKNAIVTGNGKQTDVIKISGNASQSLANSLKETTYEPDKYHTPRITGLLLSDQSKLGAALSIIKSGVDNSTERKIYELELKTNQGYFISTYAGPNIRPTPSFDSDPILLDLYWSRAEQAAQQIYDYFAPEPENTDLRVSVMVIQTDKLLQERTVAIINHAK